MEQWKVLTPWCKWLRGRLQLEEYGKHVPHPVRRPWLLLLLPKYQRSVGSELLPKLRESLTLLALVAKVDPVALSQLLRDNCGVDCSAHDVGDFKVILVLDDHTGRSVLWPELLCKSLLALDGVAPSEEFSSAKTQLETIATRKLGRVPKVAIPFCIHFAPRDVNLMGLQQYLQSVERVMNEVVQHYGPDPGTLSEKVEGSDTNQEDAVRDSTRWPFAFEAMQLNLREFELTESVSRCLQGIVLRGAKVSCLQLPLKATDFLSHDECPRQSLAECLQAVAGGGPSCRLFSSTLEPEMEERERAPKSYVETVVLNDVDMDDRRFAALCASLSEATGVKELVLESAFVQDARYAREMKWKWLTYALFTPNGKQTSVKKLTINEPQLLMDDVLAIAAVVNSRKPARELLDPLWAEHEAHQRQVLTSKQKDQVRDQQDWGDDGADGDDMVRLKKDTVVYLEPLCSEDEWLQNAVVLNQDASFPVMNSELDDEKSSVEWVEILVPGFGKCWVHPDVATDRYVCNSDSDDWRGITELVLTTQITKSASDKMLAQLFQLIGCDLITVLLHTNWLREDCLGSILRACPSLQTLRLVGAQVDDMFAFTHGYDVGYCQLESLSLEHFHVSAASLAAFAKVLADPEREAARHLRQLSIGRLRMQDIDGAPTDYEEMVEAFATMLDSNTTLELLKLHIDGDFYSRFAKNFMRHQGQVLPPKELSVPSKLAFLSVNPLRKTTTRLGNHLTRRIFRYAASHVVREINIQEH